MHEDYLALKGESRSRLRYLLALLAKDLVTPEPGAHVIARWPEAAAHCYAVSTPSKQEA